MIKKQTMVIVPCVYQSNKDDNFENHNKLENESQY